jgi:hypothetical protein
MDVAEPDHDKVLQELAANAASPNHEDSGVGDLAKKRAAKGL